MDTKIADVMVRDLLLIREDATIEEGLRILFNHKITGLPVVNADGKMVGVMSEIDLFNVVAKAPEGAADVFTSKINFSKKVESINENANLNDAIDHFVNHARRRLPVVDDSGNLVGIITRRDIVRIFYYRAMLGNS